MSDKHFLVLDTNVWVYTTSLLSTALGAAVIYALNQTGRTLALPEVIGEEIRKHTIKRGKDAVELIQKNYFLIEQLMGVRDDYRVPSEEQLAERVDIRLKELGDRIVRTDFTLEHAKRALHRVIEESPPNRYKNQQFKDSAIWEAILDLAKVGDVDFVTEDNDFFEERNPKLGLAENLRQDCERAQCPVRVFYKLDSYLESIKQELPELDRAEIARTIDEVIKADLEEMAIDKGYELGDLSETTVSAYLTEKPNIFAVRFEFAYRTAGVKLPESEEEVTAMEVVKGDCTYELGDRVASEVHFDKISLVDASGKTIPRHGVIFVRAECAMFGRKTIPYKLREPLPGKGE